MTADRREKPRVASDTIEALEVTIPYTLSVVPLNLSETGMCGRWAMPLPQNIPFPLTLQLPRPILVTARAVWQHPLPGGQTLAALTFVHMSERSAATVRAWVKSARRTAPRHADFIAVEVVHGEPPTSFTAVASDFSRDGLQINNDFALADDAVVTVLLPLGSTDLLDLQARVRWHKKTGSDGAVIGLQFVHPPKAAQVLIDRYVASGI